MQAYVTPETGPAAQLRPVDNKSASDQTAVLDLILEHLAARVADQITARLAASPEASADHLRAPCSRRKRRAEGEAPV
jgi:hypothetical protein